MSPQPPRSCPSCGADSAHGGAFCAQCGAPFATTSEHPPPPPLPSASEETSGRPWVRRTLIGAAGAAIIAVAVFVVLQLIGGDTDRDWLAVEWDTEVVDGALGGRPGGLYAAHRSGRIAYEGDDAICVTQAGVPDSQRCAPFDRSPAQHAAWSPDGRYLVFTEDAFRFFLEPDVWVWDLENDRIDNLTDDAVEGRLRIADDADADMFPVFVADREIAFLRLRPADDGPPHASLWTVGVDGNDPVEVAPDLVPLDWFASNRVEAPIAFPVGRGGRWHLMVADPDDPELAILAVTIPSGDAIKTPVTGAIALDARLFVEPDPTGFLVGVNEECYRGTQPEQCHRFVIDPVAATALMTPALGDDRFDAEEGPFPDSFPTSVSPDGTAVAGCFTTGFADERITLLAIADLDDLEWKVIAEWDQEVGGGCGDTPAWTDAGIAVALFGEDRYLFLTPAE